MAAAPRRPHVRKTSEDAATHDLLLMKNSLQIVDGNN